MNFSNPYVDDDFDPDLSEAISAAGGMGVF
jgi:hypothetical protein